MLVGGTSRVHGYVSVSRVDEKWRVRYHTSLRHQRIVIVYTNTQVLPQTTAAHQTHGDLLDYGIPSILRIHDMDDLGVAETVDAAYRHSELLG